MPAAAGIAVGRMAAMDLETVHLVTNPKV